MSNYKETTVSGDSWQRSFAFLGLNEHGKTPSIAFLEERITMLSDGRKIVDRLHGADIFLRTGGTARDSKVLRESLTDPQKSFDLINPETGDVVGTATYEDVYLIMFSLYAALCAARDTK